MNFKKFPAVLLLGLVLFSASAATWTISQYDFDITGRTKASAVSSLIVPNNKEVFQTEEALENALADKKQVLVNLRLFKSVSYEWSVIDGDENNSNVSVHFFITDASSFLFLPYPRYDSNYGLLLGLRVKEHNLLGQFANIDAWMDMTQRNNSFKEARYQFEVPITNIKLGGVGLTFKLSGDVDLYYKDNAYLRFDFTENNWAVGTAVIRSDGYIKHFYNNPENSVAYLSVGESGLKIGDNRLNLSTILRMNLKHKDTGKAFLNKWTFNADYTGVKVGEANLTFSLNSQLFPQVGGWMGRDPENPGNSDYDSEITFGTRASNIKAGTVVITEAPALTFSAWMADTRDFHPKRLANTITFDFTGAKLKNLKLTNSLTWKIDEKYSTTNTTLSFRMFDKFTDSVIIKTRESAAKGMEWFYVDFKVDTTFKLFDGHLTLVPAVTLYNRHTVTDWKVTDYKLTLEFMTTMNLSGGEINYVSSGEKYWAFRDNFRKGIRYNLQGAVRVVPVIDQKPGVRTFIRGTVEAFPVIGTWFNPSFRLLGLVSHTPITWFRYTDSTTHYVYSEADADIYNSYNLYVFDKFEFSKTKFNEMLRGIRLNNPVVESGGYNSRYVLIGNVNLMTSFLNFEDFGHAYLNPFYDFALFAGGADGVKYLHGAGIELIAILNSHPSYPLRASFGVNIDSFINKFIRKNDTPLEYELFIGLGHSF